MREHFPPPPEQAGRSASGTDDANAPSASANELPPGTAAGADGAGFFVPPAESVADGSVAFRWRHRLPWIFISLLVLAIVAIAPTLVRKWQAEQALRQVASVAGLSAEAPVVAPVVAPVAAPGLAAAPVTPVTPDTPSPAPAVVPASVLPGAAAGLAGAAALASATPQPPAAPSVNPSQAKATGDASTAMDAAAQPPKRSREARVAKRDGVHERRVAKRGAARDGGTFKRCPPLGKKGAVMCRWHICNGGAGKEAACRPYLERRP